ncbi:MAG: FHA domain-containing protein [Myxococcales bacterium]|nr:FHA domain-containing protein [Myxococcales bacterium]
MHKLIIEDDEGKSVVVPLIRDEITVGRQEGNTVRLTEQNISRHHARFVRQDGTLFVEDLASYNGIRLNGEPVKQRTALKDGDQIAIGDYKLGLKAADGRAAAPAVNRARVGSETPPPRASSPSPSPALGMQGDIIEGAPTIPVRTLADQGLDFGLNAPPPGRLVVMSTQLSGAEFALDRASLVIGRTPENDIILNHKSISRHHAKVIRDGERYVVVDLESANGVRVNGAPQERMVLDSGDVIELGHVRLKFLVGEDVFGAASLPGLRGSKKPLVISAAVASVVLAIVVFAMSGGDEAPAPPPVAQTRPEPAAPETPTPPPAPPAAPEPEPPPAAPVPQPQGPTLESVSAMIAQGQWDQAQATLGQLPPAVQAGPEGVALKKQIAVERAAEAALARLEVEAEAGRIEPARKIAAAIAADSRFAGDATRLVEQAQQTFVAARLNVAEGHKAAGRCTDARKEAEKVLKLVPGQPAATALVAACAAAPAPVAAARPAPQDKPREAERPARLAAAPKAPPPPRPAPRANAPVALTEDPLPPGDADEYIKEAQDAWLKGQYAAAIASSRKALRLKPGLVRAYQIIAVCSCSLRDQAGAVKAYERLDDKNKQLVRSLCERNGISLPE